MIDLSQLSQEQLWGLMFVTQQRNLQIKAANDMIPEGSDIEPQPYITVKQYLTNVLNDTLNSYYKQCIDAKVQNTIAGFFMQPPEVQQQTVEQLNIQDVIDPALAPLE